jgi:predicted TIM-barrel fold metal-dependent hydrolase
MAEAPLVDAHAHVFTRDMPLIGAPRHRPNYDFTTEQYLATLDAHRIEFGVIAAASIYGDYNDYTIEAVRRSPRLRGTVILEPTVERYVLEQMKRDGIVGVRLPYLELDPLPDLTSFEYRRTLRRFADLDWHVHLHIEGDRAPPLIDILEASRVRLVIDHMGRPNAQTGINSAGFKAILRSVEKGRTWVKLSAGYRMGPAAMDYGRELLRRVGPERLVWASDCPFVGHEAKVRYQETIDWFVTCVPDPAIRRIIGGDTPMKLYFS